MIGECLDGLTGRRLDRLGIGSGWRCLEVGGRDAIGAALEALDDSTGWFPGPAVMGVRARRP
jgi:hypothetical protein